MNMEAKVSGTRYALAVKYLAVPAGYYQNKQL